MNPDLIAALTGQLRSILEKPLTAETLRELESTTRAARQLFLALSAPSMAFAPRTVLDEGTIIDNAPFVTATPTPVAETYGASMIRELISTMNTKKDPKDDPSYKNVGYEIDCLSRAYENAQRAGLEEESQRIRDRIHAILDVTSIEGENDEAGGVDDTSLAVMEAVS
jgi:hypothetical protein